MKLSNETLGKTNGTNELSLTPLSPFTTTCNIFQKDKYDSFHGDKKKKKSLHLGANCYFLFPKLSFWLELIQRICLSTYSPLKLPHLEAITCIFKYGTWPREVLTNDRGLEPGWQSETRMKNWARERHERKNVSFTLWSKRPRPCREAMVMSNTVQRRSSESAWVWVQTQSPLTKSSLWTSVPWSLKKNKAPTSHWGLEVGQQMR